MDPSLSHLISWSEPTRGDAPLPLTGPSLTMSPLGAPHPPTVFLFGGKFVQNRRLSSEMWAIDLGSRVWERVDAGDGPAPRYFHTMDVWEDKLVCFGGMSETEPHMSVHDDIWFFDCVRRQWLPQPQPEHGLQDPSLLPSARYAHLSAVSRGKLVVSGGQHSDNSWIYEINVYDLKRQVWVSKTDQPERQGLHSKGAYRSVAASAKHRVITPRKDAKSAHTYSIDEEGEGGEIMCYSNYDFAKVRRELDQFTPLDLRSSPSAPSAKHHSPPSFNITDVSSRMHGSAQPPGLRFPTGGIVGNHFILCGLYLASTSAAFSVYALNLETLVWRHLEPAVLSTGSWNRAVVWADKAKLLVFGNQESDLAADYGRRAVSVDHMAVVSLETFGIYTPPKLEIPAKVQEAGLTMLDQSLTSDFEVVCDDGRRIKCSKRLLSERWAWFAQQEQDLRAKAAGVVSDVPLDINDTLLGAFNPARLESTHLTLPEPFPVCVAFVQYFYTLSLSTPLQNRAPVLSALLFLAKQYKIDRLAKLVVHALHERLDNTNAVGVYEIATLTGQQNLQVRALNMIHSAKNGSSTRSHRQGPPPAHAGENGSSQDSPQVPPSSHGFSSPAESTAIATPTSTHANGVTVHQAPLQARSESPTLGMHEDDEDASAMLSALDINSPPIPTRLRSASATAPIPPLARTPLPTPPHSAHSRRGSMTSSEATSLVTPAESLAGSSIRESSIFPRGTSVDSRGSSVSSQGKGQSHGQPKALETLPEDPSRLGRSISTSSTTRRDYSIHQPHAHQHHGPSHAGANGNGHGVVAPPSAYSSHQAQIIQALSTYQMDGRMPIPPHVHRSQSLNHGNIYVQQQGHPSHSSASASGQAQGPSVNRHLSVQTQSSTSSTYSDDHAVHHPNGHNRTPPSASGTTSTTEFHLSLDSASSVGMSTLSRFDSHSSGSTGASGSKKQQKEEKKAIALAEKAAKKQAQQERFEALRMQQAKAMALAKAEVQRKAEIEAAQPPPPKPAPKGRFGKFGSKLADNVLFPSSGNSNSMF